MEKNKKRKIITWMIGLGLASILISNPFWLRIPSNIETKDEMIRFCENHLDELERIVDEIGEIHGKTDDYITIVDAGSYFEYNLHSAYFMIKKYPIMSISACEEETNLYVKWYFKNAPRLYDDWYGDSYWGIYYIESGEPQSDVDTELTKNGDIYVHGIENSYEYQTEQISGNWYYWHRQWRSATAP